MSGDGQPTTDLQHLCPVCGLRWSITKYEPCDLCAAADDASWG